MLRTHGELGYRQEQRFHLELGLLKMAHAQRLLPLEQLLSEAAGQVGVSRTQTSVPSRPAPDVRRGSSEVTTTARSNYVSPFSADSARKGNPKAEVASDTMPSAGPRLVSSTPASAPVVMGATAPAPAAVAQPEVGPEQEARASEAAIPQETSKTEPFDRTAALRDAVITAIANTGQRMLASMIESGEWRLDGNELVIQVAASATVIDMSFTNEAKRLIIAAASGVLGRPARLRVLPGGVPESGQTAPRTNGSGRGRAEQEPIVRRMKEKFGAEIRTIIDYRDKP
jgi:DNA polymerase III subunit gamma/tau